MISLSRMAFFSFLALACMLFLTEPLFAQSVASYFRGGNAMTRVVQVACVVLFVALIILCYKPFKR
jgi:hypothetical protein